MISGLFIYATQSRWLTLFTFFFGTLNVATSSANGFFQNTTALPPRMAFILLLTIVTVKGLLSAPSPLQLIAFDQLNVAVLRFPYALLPGLVVPLMFTSHFLMLR